MSSMKLNSKAMQKALTFMVVATVFSGTFAAACKEAVLLTMNNKVLAQGVFTGIAVMTLGVSIFLAYKLYVSYRATYIAGVQQAILTYAKTQSAQVCSRISNAVATSNIKTLDALMKEAGYTEGFNSLLAVTNSRGMPRFPSQMVDINGVRYSSLNPQNSGAQDDFPSFGFNSFGPDISSSDSIFSGPSVNIDGAPMVGSSGIDINGNPYGTT